MIEIVDSSHTLYAFYLKVECDRNIEIGRLGNYYFEKGIYIYVGSAKRNIVARINRHKQVDKVQKWHFDYLRPYGTVLKIITYETSIGECQLAEKIRKEDGGIFPIKRFGSSDCKCYSHLIYIKK